MTNEILKEEYFNTVELYNQLDSRQKKEFLPRLNEVKNLKDKALKTVSKVSKTYLFKQGQNKLQEIKKEILDILEKEEVEKYKGEIERLQTMFKQREFNDREKEYLIKKVALLNGFDYKHFKIYIKENSKLIATSIMSDVESLFSLS